MTTTDFSVIDQMFSAIRCDRLVERETKEKKNQKKKKVVSSNSSSTTTYNDKKF